MTRLILILLMFLVSHNLAWPAVHDRSLLVDVNRAGQLYSINARFNSALTPCAAYHFLTDYEEARKMPGVIELFARRQSPIKVVVDLTAKEHVLIFYVKLHSVMEYTENPFKSISFTQLSGDLKTFQGKWEIDPYQQGSSLIFNGELEQDTRMPMVIIDYFVKSSLENKFNAIAELAGKYKDIRQNNCRN